MVARRRAGVILSIVFLIVFEGFQVQAVQAPVAVLRDGTPVRLRINRTLSSAEAKVGDSVDFEVLDEVRIGDVVVIPRGGLALATVTDAEPKKTMGRAGKIDINIDHVRLVDGEDVPLRAIKETEGGGHIGAMTGAIVATSLVFFPAAPLFLFMHGKDITIPKGTEVTAYINGNISLDLARLRAASGAAASISQPASIAAPTRPPDTPAAVSDMPRTGSERPIVLPADKATDIISIKRVFVDAFGDDGASRSLQGWVVNALTGSSRVIVTENSDRADAVLKRSVMDSTFAFRLISKDGDVVWSTTQQSGTDGQEIANTVVARLLAAMIPPPPPLAETAPTAGRTVPAAQTTQSMVAAAPAPHTETSPNATTPQITGIYAGTVHNITKDITASLEIQIKATNNEVYGCLTVGQPLIGSSGFRGVTSGPEISFDSDKKAGTRFVGTIHDEEFTGTFTIPAVHESGEFSLKRVTSGVPPIDYDPAHCGKS